MYSIHLTDNLCFFYLKKTELMTYIYLYIEVLNPDNGVCKEYYVKIDHGNWLIF